MPLDTYANLQASILSWLARPGDPLVSPSIPDIIELFEREATRRLKVGGAEKRVSLTALSAAVALPADFGELRLATSGGVILTYVTPMQLPDGGGPPAHYTIIGNEMRLGPSPSGGCTVEIVYQSGVPPLSDSNPSNWLLAAHPDCYLFGSLVEAESFIGSDERIPLWAQRREAAFASIETADRKARWGGAPLSIRAEGVSGGNGTAAGDWTSAPPVPIPIAAIVAGDGLTGGGTEGIVTLALDTPVSVANGGTGATTAAAGPFVQKIGDTITGDLTIATAVDAVLRINPGGMQEAYFGASATAAYIGTFGTTPLEFSIGDAAPTATMYSTGNVGIVGDVYAQSCNTTGVGDVGGLAFRGTATAGSEEGWYWSADAGIARFSRWTGATKVGDVLTADFTTGAITFPISPNAPTPPPGDSDTSVATTGFVAAAIAAGGSGINQLTGDVIAGPGSGSQVTTLATVNANVGTFQGLTLDAKGRVTAASNQSYLAANQTITLSGDLTGSGTTSINAQIAANAVGTAEIAAGNVTYAKLQNTAAARLLGNPTGSPAAPSEISLGTGLSFAGAVLNGSVGTLTGITQGTGITVSGAAPSPTVALTAPVSVANGGTNAITAPAALTSLGAAPLAGATFTGKVITPASAAGGAGLNAPHGAAPTAPANGDVWTTTAGLFARVNGATVGPYGIGSANGMSGMTAGQLPVAATANTITSSIALPLGVANGGTGASALALSNPGALGLSGTFLQTNGSTVSATTGGSNAGTVGTYGGGWVVAVAAAGGGGIGSARCNGTLAAPTALASGDVIGGLYLDGYAIGGWNAATRTTIECVTTEAWSGTAQGSRLNFTTTPTGGVVTAVQMSINSGVIVGAPTGSFKGAGTLNAVTVYGNNVVLTSDISLKDDIGPLPAGLELVQAVEPKQYRWKPLQMPEPVPGPDGEPQKLVFEPPEDFTTRERWGFVAGDLEEAPGVFVKGNDGIEGVDMGGLVAVLWQAVRELSAEVTALKAGK